jgi:hypothetical protein
MLSKRLLDKKMEVVYKDMDDDDDDDEEDIPDEDSNTSEIIQFHGRIVPRDSITSNIMPRSFIGVTPFAHISISNQSNKRMITDGQRNKILSTQGSVISSTINPMEMLSSVSSKNGINIIEMGSQERAILNWSMLYRKCMQEYRRHRLKKVSKGMVVSPSPKKSNVPKRQKDKNGKIVMRHAQRYVPDSAHIYDFYPCVRFIQRCMKIKISRKSLRYTSTPG